MPDTEREPTAVSAINRLAAVTVAPAPTTSEPVPASPMMRSDPIVQCEPAPVTDAVPLAPANSPSMAPSVLLPVGTVVVTTAPAAIVSVPDPFMPTTNPPLLVSVEPAPVIVAVPEPPA